mmetsp:Transcript_31185/g.56559  ORF Transcript_31185/g.56559 Transcript_31185/m.56559 type:complete len:560 (+) Transcript_31185:1120-2799(+)
MPLLQAVCQSLSLMASLCLSQIWCHGTSSPFNSPNRFFSKSTTGKSLLETELDKEYLARNTMLPDFSKDDPHLLEQQIDPSWFYDEAALAEFRRELRAGTKRSASLIRVESSSAGAFVPTSKEEALETLRTLPTSDLLRLQLNLKFYRPWFLYGIGSPPDHPIPQGATDMALLDISKHLKLVPDEIVSQNLKMQFLSEDDANAARSPAMTSTAVLPSVAKPTAMAISSAASSSAVSSSARPSEVKIFVYDLPTTFNYELLNLTTWHEKSYDADVHLHMKLLKHPARTLDADSATFFFVPVYGTRYLHKMLFKGGVPGDFYQAQAAANAFYKSVLPYLHHWNKQGPSKHIFAMTHDIGRNLWGPECEMLKDAISLQHNGVDFRKQHDIIIPPAVDPNLTPWPSQRTQFAVFRGSSEDPRYEVRKKLNQIFLKNPEVLVTSETSSDWKDELLHTDFCLVPSGLREWSFRFYEVALRGCIPVIVGKVYNTMPFEDLLDYSKCTIRLLADSKEASDASSFEQLLKSQDKTQLRNSLYAATSHWDWTGEQVVSDILQELQKTIH